ncbi:hypothetical protein V2J09_020994 [Rumex salicifolius]
MAKKRLCLIGKTITSLKAPLLLTTQLLRLNQSVVVVCWRMDPNPPLEETYRALFNKSSSAKSAHELKIRWEEDDDVSMEEVDLPLIDLGMKDKEKCRREIAEASKEWGFFRVVNHGVSPGVLDAMREEQVRLFREPFVKKKNDAFLNMSPGSYRWGSPTATCLCQLSWSEAFHVPLGDFASAAWGAGLCTYPRYSSSAKSTLGPEGIFPSNFRSPMRRFATKVSELAQDLASILAEHLGQDSSFFKQNCLPSTCYLRMNRYPPCPNYSKLFGLMPHTDSDFLTVLHEDQVGGLQLVKDGKWIAVKPNSKALLINIGDLFQAWSNGVYKSVEHRVVANEAAERFSTAYFFCSSNDAVIRSCGEPRVYKEFSFREYRQQVERDVTTLGRKIGLSRFLFST